MDLREGRNIQEQGKEKASAFMNWSGGKDSALALHKILNAGQVRITALLTSVNATHNRISMHGVRRELLEAQAGALNIPLHTVELPELPDMKEYEVLMIREVESLRRSGCSQAIFGDIFLEDLRRYREEKLGTVGVDCLFPLWKTDTRMLVEEFIALGYRSVVVCVSERSLDRSFCGRVIDEDFLRDLPPGVDPCGENGEFHSYVYEGPLFRQPIPFRKGELRYRKYDAPKQSAEPAAPVQDESSYGFYFRDLIPV